MQTDRRQRARKYVSDDSRIPTAAPELWRGSRIQAETLESFFRRVWAPYLPYGLQSVQIRRLDAALWKALHQHIVRYEQAWPADLEIPNLRPRLPDTIARLDQGRWRELTDDDIIAALISRARTKALEEVDALRTRKRELRQNRAAEKKTLKTRSRTTRS